MHELGEILREAVRPIQAEAVAVSAQSDQHGCKIVLVHSALCRIANLLSGYGAQSVPVASPPGRKGYPLRRKDERNKPNS